MGLTKAGVFVGRGNEGFPRSAQDGHQLPPPSNGAPALPAESHSLSAGTWAPGGRPVVTGMFEPDGTPSFKVLTGPRRTARADDEASHSTLT